MGTVTDVWVERGRNGGWVEGQAGIVPRLPALRYDSYRERGIRTGSGVVEAGCRRSGLRLKRSGTRWSEKGANAMPSLKSCVMSHRLADLLDWRANQPAAVWSTFWAAPMSGLGVALPGEPGYPHCRRDSRHPWPGLPVSGGSGFPAISSARAASPPRKWPVPHFGVEVRPKFSCGCSG